ncbi:hypothetical protein K439DRAFT_1626860 [Ramaria rubella]|nr:hypothetical protein K439DRAFT_1626860 [Ramaria rubella]
MTLSRFSDVEFEAAHRGVALHQGEIASLDYKIASLLQTVDSLRTLKEDHYRQLRRCESVLTLARRLPLDLLGQIFESCAGLYPAAPLILSQVCASWRIAAHSTPRIWCRLFVDGARPRSVERIAHWISMSGSYLPLHITLLPHDISLHSVMRAVVRHSARWKTFSVDAIASHIHEVLDIIRIQDCQLPILETLMLTVHDDTSQQILDIREACTDKLCPQLETIRLRSDSRLIARQPAQITDLSLNMSALGLEIHLQIMGLLHSLPRLRRFAIELQDDGLQIENPTPVGGGILVMQELHTVILVGRSSLFEILVYLTLPSLGSLALRENSTDVSQTPRVGSYFVEMVERSSPPIRRLELHGIDATENDFLRCFMWLVELEELILHDSEISNMVFCNLCSAFLDDHNSAAQWICPRLSRLDLRWCSQLSGNILAKLVEARLMSSYTSNISEVVVINCLSVREEDVLSLAAMTVCRLKNYSQDFCCMCFKYSNQEV